MRLIEILNEGVNQLTHFVRSSNNADKVIAFRYGVCQHCGEDANEAAVTMSVADAKALGLEEADELPPDLTIDEEGDAVCRHCTEYSSHIDDPMFESLNESVSDEKFANILRNFKVYEEPMGDAVFMDDGTPCLSLEHGHTAGYAGDYYGEFSEGGPYVSPKLEKLAEKHGRFIEWLNPGAIGFYRI